MASMGRHRKEGLGPEYEDLEPRVYFKHGAYYYVHREGNLWEPLGAEKEQANRKGKLYNDPTGQYGTMVYWLEMFIADCDRRVALKSQIKNIKMSQRTRDDYAEAVGTEEEPGPLRLFFKPPITPLDIETDDVQDFINDSAEAGRPVQGNRHKAALSACISWLLREGHVPGLKINPCFKVSGVQKNPESKRKRYVTNEEYLDVWDVASRAEQLMMELVYRTLQRPESDVILWNLQEHVAHGRGGRRLRFRQNKTQRDMEIALSPRLDELIRRPVGSVRKLKEPLVARQDGGFYTYDGLSSMLKESIRVANLRRKARGIDPIPSFGFRDLKGKGATDMWLAGTPIEQIQALLGHASKTTTEIYIKQRYVEAVQSNTLEIARGGAV